MRYTKENEREIKALEQYGFEKVKLYDNCDEGSYYDALMDGAKVEVWVDKTVKWRYFGVKSVEEIEWYDIGTIQFLESAELDKVVDEEIANEEVANEELANEEMNDAVDEGEVVAVAKMDIDELTESNNNSASVEELMFNNELPLVADDKETTLEFISEIQIEEQPKPVKETKTTRRKRKSVTSSKPVGTLAFLEENQMSLFEENDSVLELYIKK